jgi:hypothetical protein
MLREFDELLLQVIDRTVRYTFGDTNADIIYDYLEKKGCGFHEIPAKLIVFSEELRNIVGSGRGQFLGVAPILEEAILELLCAELKTKYDRQSSGSFADQVKKLEEFYEKRNIVSQSMRKNSSQEHVSPYTIAVTEGGGES